jgi:hypothetical protein
MADTVRDRSSILVLLADNTSGNISPQDLRDAFVSTWNELDGIQTGHEVVDAVGAWITFPIAFADKEYVFEAWGIADASGIANQYKIDVLWDWDDREETRIFVQPNEDGTVVFWRAQKVTVS